MLMLLYRLGVPHAPVPEHADAGRDRSGDENQRENAPGGGSVEKPRKGMQIL